MRDLRNPFLLPRAENIDTDTTFLSLFEPGILESLPDNGLPDTVQPVRSAAGGGKTSLLRLFTPSVLQKLHARRTDELVKDLFQRVQSLGAVDEKGPRLLGVLLLCGRNYAVLQGRNLEQAIRNRLFFGLLNARIILAVLRSALHLKNLEYPQDLSRLQVGAHEVANDLPPDLHLPCSGLDLYDWARAIERTICGELDSFGPLRKTSLPGHDSLFALSIIRPDTLTIDDKPVAERVLLMMDDIQMLTENQRSMLVERVIEARSRVGVWIAERFEALNTQEMLASGSDSGRDRDKPIEIEWYWRKHYDRFEKHVMRIADRRARISTETERSEFRTCLEDDLEAAEWEPVFNRAIEEVEARVRERVRGTVLFQKWVDARQRLSGTPAERALAWRALEILVERELRRPQKGLYDEIEPLDETELQEKSDSRIKQAAELFLAREFDLPYYYGPERIARLASLNIAQFLGLGGKIFEEVIAAELLRGGTQILSAKRQHELMKKAALTFWNDITKKVRHGRELRTFLESVGKFSAWYTYDYRPTAPNDPGVGGTAIRMSERQALMDTESNKRYPERRKFADVLASALAHNYLVADLDASVKGERWMVLNLNRLLCVHFDLPLGYGLFKERPLAELCRWIEQPFLPPMRRRAWYERRSHIQAAVAGLRAVPCRSVFAVLGLAASPERSCRPVRRRPRIRSAHVPWCPENPRGGRSWCAGLDRPRIRRGPDFTIARSQGPRG